MTYQRIFFTLLVGCCFYNFSSAQINLTGTVKDDKASLSGASIYIQSIKKGTTSTAQGTYQLTIPKSGTYKILYSYFGHEDKSITVQLTKDTTIDVTLPEQEQEIEAVTITSQSQSHVLRPTMGVENLSMKSIKKIPSLMGEVDVIKAIQMLPGVQPVAEGTSAYSVRGGTPDQNLVLLDNATVYNPSHLMGFFSVFNNDVVRDITLYKGDIPAKYGGRLSSLLDVETKEFEGKPYGADGGIGLIASRLKLEGEFLDHKLYAHVAGRRTYADLFLYLSPIEAMRGTVLHFYDLNAKVSYAIGKKDRISLSGYFGRDNFGTSFAGMLFGNATGTLKWSHIFSDNLTTTTSAVFSDYRYDLGTKGTLNTNWQSNITDWGLQNHTSLILHNHTLRFGLSGNYYNFRPGDITANILGSNMNISMDKQNAFTVAGYFSHQILLLNKLTLQYGLRYTFFGNVGQRTVLNLNNQYEVVDSTLYGKNDVYGTYHLLEPRVNVVYQLTDNSSVKASYGRNEQTIHLLSVSTAGSPLDIWVPSSPNIKPQVVNQFSTGYFHTLFPKKLDIEVSGEVFYKRYSNLVDFKDHTQPTLNTNIDGDIRKGKGYSYGLEVMIRKQAGQFSGWVSYTFSRSFRTVETVNLNRQYSAISDRPHNLNIVAMYEITPRINVSANWTYVSGMPTTFPEGRMVINGETVPIYSARNSYRLPDYHRLDLSATFTLNKKKNAKWRHDLNVSVYNAYWRKNPWYITFTEDENNPGTQKAQMTYLFPIVPSITYNFSF